MFEFSHLKFKISNDLGRRHDQNRSCSTQRYKKLYSSKLFHLNSFRVTNTYFKIWYSEYEKNLHLIQIQDLWMEWLKELCARSLMSKTPC